MAKAKVVFISGARRPKAPPLECLTYEQLAERFDQVQAAARAHGARATALDIESLEILRAMLRYQPPFTDPGSPIARPEGRSVRVSRRRVA